MEIVFELYFFYNIVKVLLYGIYLKLSNKIVYGKACRNIHLRKTVGTTSIKLSEPDFE